MAMAKSITGRDGYILCQALCYAIETIKRLPDRWQEASNAEDMQRILDASLVLALSTCVERAHAISSTVQSLTRP
jgi:hypothetical protein